MAATQPATHSAVSTPVDWLPNVRRIADGPMSSTHPYVVNLAGVWASDPTLARRLDGDDTLLRPASPVDSSDALRTTDTARHSVYYVFGLGDGTVLRELHTRASDESRIWVFEPDLDRLRTTLHDTDFADVLRDGRVRFVTRTDKAELFAMLQPFAAMFALGVGVAVGQSAVEPSRPGVDEAFFATVQRLAEEFAAFCRTSLQTLVLNGRATAENVARNVSRYAASNGLARLKNAYQDRPAIIVAAGPSLRKNRHLLRDAEGRAVFIAVQTALRPLLDLGVVPQFVTSLDYHAISSRFFEGLPHDLPTELVAEPKANDRVLNAHPGPLSLLGNDFADGVLRDLPGFVLKPRLPAGATVAHLAFYLAEFMGCDPITLVGQDLAFADGLAYLPGTSYDYVWRPECGRFCTIEQKQWEHIARDRAILRRVPAANGGTVYTEERLFAYLQQFERDFARAAAEGTTVIDATEGGALKRGATTMTLQAVLANHAPHRLDLTPPPHPGNRPHDPDDVAECLGRRADEADRIADLCRRTLPLLNEVRDALGREPARVNRAIARIDNLRDAMDVLGPTYDLVTMLGQKAELQRFTADRLVASSRARGVERQRRQIERDLANVEGVLANAQDFAGLMRSVAEATCREADGAQPTDDVRTRSCA